MKRNVRQIVIYILVYVYLILGYSYIIYFISYNIRIANKAEGWIVMLVVALLYYILYIAINHVIIRKIISNKLLIIIDALLFTAMLTLVICDMNYEHYLHLQHLKRTIPNIITPPFGTVSV